MTYQSGSDARLTESELRALLTEKSSETVYTVNQNIYQKVDYDGAAGFEQGQKLLFHQGQEVTESVVDALFVPATVAAITPATGPAAGGTVVTITGSNFAGTTGVTFGGAAGTAFSVLSNTAIRVTTPAGTAGAKAVVVQDDAGDVTVSSGFTYA